MDIISRSSLISNVLQAHSEYLQSLEIMESVDPRLAKNLFAKNLAVQLSSQIVIKHHDKGLCANILAVLDTLSVSPHASIFVDWTPNGKECDFTYGNKGENLWNELFEPIHDGKSFLDPIIIDGRICPLSSFKGRNAIQCSSEWTNYRSVRNMALNKYLILKNQRCINHINHVKSLIGNKDFVSVHRRLPSPEVARYQLNGRVPDIDAFITATEMELMKLGGSNMIFLATDHQDSALQFQRRFGKKLIIRKVTRSIAKLDGSYTEVHRRMFDEVSVQDAEDVLIDCFCLSMAHTMIHASSNISTLAACINPKMKCSLVNSN